jgi:hypothetical protein
VDGGYGRDSLVIHSGLVVALSSSQSALPCRCEVDTRTVRVLRSKMSMSRRRSFLPNYLPRIRELGVVAILLGCTQYPSTPRDVVIKFVTATQSSKIDSRTYLSTSLKSRVSEKGFKYTFGDAIVKQSVPQADEKYAILVKKVRLGSSGAVVETAMRVMVSKERDRWVISRMVAGVPDPEGTGNSEWLNSDGI